jgi:hypothetical protein
MTEPNLESIDLAKNIPVPVDNAPHEQRLHAALLDAQRRLTELQQKLGGPGEAESNANFKAARDAWRLSVWHAGRKRRYVAWDCLHQVDDSLIAGRTDEKELKALWCSLDAEADEKLVGWREKAADGLEALFKADKVFVARQLHGHLAATAQNMQFKLDIFEHETLPTIRNFLALVVSSAVLLAVLVILLKPSGTLMPWADDLLLGIAAGALGGVLSMTFSLGRADLKTKIPESRLGRLATSIRPLIGAAVAIPVVVFVKAEFVSVKGFQDELAIFAFCFLGGFSERWFLGLIERFEDSATEKKKEAKATK